jgi:hypothetical protein
MNIEKKDKVVILVPKDIKTKHPSLATMKMITYCNTNNIQYQIHSDKAKHIEFVPDTIFLSTLFTYNASKYSDWISHYQKLFPHARWVVGGIFASLMPQYFKDNHNIVTHVGLDNDLDSVIPDYRALEEHGISTNKIIMYASRGCPNTCGFCCVPKIEGAFKPMPSISTVIEEAKKQRNFDGLVLFDNNFTAHPNFVQIVDEIRENNLPVDFSQGLDNLIITEEQIQALAKVSFLSQSKNGTTYIRFALDKWKQIEELERSLLWCKAHKVRAEYFAYFLYNFNDTPQELYQKLRCVEKSVLKVGKTVFLFPQEYEPLTSLKRHTYVSRGWTKQQLRGFRKLYTHIHGFLPITKTSGLFNWVGKDEQQFVNLIEKYGRGEKIEKL